MTNPWFKFFGGEYISDPKMCLLDGNERSCWITLLCIASTSSDPGKVEFLTVDTLIRLAGVIDNGGRYQETLEKFKKMKMVEISDDGAIAITNWKKRQERAMTGYERIKKYRENKAKMGEDNDMITNDNAKDNSRREENREEENRIEREEKITKAKTPTPKKVEIVILKDTHGELGNVKLSKEELEKLVATLGKYDTDSQITNLDLYIAKNGKDKYKSHYATILSWSRNDQKKRSDNSKKVYGG